MLLSYEVYSGNREWVAVASRFEDAMVIADEFNGFVVDADGAVYKALGRLIDAAN